MSYAYITGLVVGVALAAAILFFVGKRLHTDGSRKPKYDERQELLRGRGYKIAFFVTLVYLVIYGLLLQKVFAPLPGAFLGIVLGVTVYASYTIWKDAYFALNEKRRGYMLLFAVIALINILGGAGQLDTMMMNGVVTGGGSINFMCAALMLVVLVELAIKGFVSCKEKDAE